jgi:hypothetical protein
MRRSLSAAAATAVLATGLLTGCGSSSNATAFCSASAALTAAGTAIQRLSPSDVAQVKSQVAALVPQVDDAEGKAPKAIRADVDQLGDALKQFAAEVARATTSQQLITSFTAYNDRAKELAEPARRVDSWVADHCSSPPPSTE